MNVIGALNVVTAGPPAGVVTGVGAVVGGATRVGNGDEAEADDPEDPEQAPSRIARSGTTSVTGQWDNSRA